MQNTDKFKHIIIDDPNKHVGEQIGHYRLLRWLGRGAFSDVYLGEHIYLKKQSAIKMLHAHLPKEASNDFLNEACTIAQLDHPNIVNILDYGLENGTPFLVMAYAPNGSLRMRFPEGTCVPLEQVIPLVQQLAAALDYAHQHQVIHRDVKPENMLIGAENQVLLSDFGLALSVHNAHSQMANAMAGTALYMAPELLGRGKVHFASDQYALGVVTYEWLCGQYPFTGSSFVQIGTQHVLIEPPSLCEKVPGLPPAVERVVFKALAKDRTQRYENVTTFADALQQASQNTRPYSYSKEVSLKTNARREAMIPTGIESTISMHSNAIPSLSSPNTSSLPSTTTKTPQSLPRPRRIRQIILLLVILVMVVISTSLGLWHSFTTHSPQSALIETTTLTTGKGTSFLTATGNAPASNQANTATALSGSTADANGKITPTPSISQTPAIPSSQPTPTPVAALDCLTGSPSSLTFSMQSPSTNSSTVYQPVTLTNCGGNTIAWSYSSQTDDSQAELASYPQDGNITLNASQQIQVVIVLSTHALTGTYHGSITFTKGTANWTVSVTYTVQ